MKANAREVLIEILLKKLLLLPSGRPELKHDWMKIPAATRIAYERLHCRSKKLSQNMSLGTFNAARLYTEEKLIVEHGWRRVDGSLLPPGKIAAAVAATRARAINPNLLMRLKDFSLMSIAYRQAVARGVCIKIIPLPA